LSSISPNPALPEKLACGFCKAILFLCKTLDVSFVHLNPKTMIRNCLFLLVFLGVIELSAQSLVEDVWTLSQNKALIFDPEGKVVSLSNSDPEALSQAWEILKKYGPLEQQFWRGNPYLDFNDPANFALLAADDRESKSIGGALGGGSSFVTFFADGLAKFIAKRTKQELTNSFFRKFKEDLARYPVLDTLFPQTHYLLNRIDKDIYFFDKYLDDLRDHFVKDLERMPTGLGMLARAHPDKLGGAESVWLSDLMRVSQLYVDGFGLKESLGYLASEECDMAMRWSTLPDTTDRKLVRNMSGSFRTINLLTNALSYTKDKKIVWCAPETLFKVLNNNKSFGLLMGILYEQGGDVQFLPQMKTGTDFQQVLKSRQRDWGRFSSFKAHFTDLVMNINQVQNAVKEIEAIKDNASTSNRSTQFYRMFDAAFGVMEIGYQLKADLTGLPVNQQEKNLLFVIRQMSELNLHLQSKEYSAAVINLGNVIDRLSWKILQKKKLAKNGQATNITVPDTTAFSSIFWKYGSFMATVAEAKNSDDVARAIESIALPPGSATMKKRNNFTFGINTYGGVSSGWEHLGDETGTITDVKGVVAPWAPLGLDISSRIGKNGGGSLGLYLPLIDVGALAAFRLNDNAAADLPKLSWSNILAPGAYLVWGFSKKSPYSLSMGGQVGPGLRKFSRMNGAEISDRQGYRLGLSLAIDIPVVPLFMR
jgi:hypothetical protein